jgi:hypothetical protein
VRPANPPSFFGIHPPHCPLLRMPSLLQQLLDEIAPKPAPGAGAARPITVRPIAQAHFVERHWVQPKLDWAAAAQKLAEVFARDTRAERPAPWYAHLAGTHWPGSAPPGNAPFYVPEWVFDDDDVAARAKALKAAGFREVIAHVVILPGNGEYLATAMRAAGDLSWNVNPRTYRCYIYPTLPKGGATKLRAYNTKRHGT